MIMRALLCASEECSKWPGCKYWFDISNNDFLAEMEAYDYIGM